MSSHHSPMTPRQAHAQRWLTSDGLADYLGLRTAHGARVWAARHGLQGIRRGRGWLFDRFDVDHLLEQLKSKSRSHRSTVGVRAA
jgi:hypothetical protein